MPLEWLGLTYTFRYIRGLAAGAGDYNLPLPLPNTTAALRRRQESFGGVAARDGRRGPCPNDPDQPSAALRHICLRASTTAPNNCDEDMVSLAKQYADHAMEYGELKATTDGIDYYAALGAVRDSDNDTLVSLRARLPRVWPRWSCLKGYERSKLARAAAAGGGRACSQGERDGVGGARAVAMARNDLNGTAPTLVAGANASRPSEDARGGCCFLEENRSRSRGQSEGRSG